MKIKDEQGYQAGKDNNLDPYGSAVYRYVEKWADIMEGRIENGEKIADIAEQTSRDTDTEGITGFQYGIAVSILAAHWEYGEELRKWHNKEYDYSGEGTVNPAIITIG